LRALIEESHFHPQHLISPLFIVDGTGKKEPIESMPCVHRYSVDQLWPVIEARVQSQVSTLLLFYKIDPLLKDPTGSEAIRKDNLLQRSIRAIKSRFPELCLMVDIALDPFTSHGHDGVLDAQGRVDNDRTLPILEEMALRAAEAGADFVAPSDMMDGRIGRIRTRLDQEGFSSVGILAYTAKYASALYGPFRNALDSTPQQGDKKGYQMNPANRREALREALLDAHEGADLLLVKPALFYLDVIQEIRAQTHLPIGAYHVSGEYSLVMAAAERGWLDPKAVFQEALLSIRRAGADFIISYVPPEWIFP
jgi:porphobilinogen synthase